MRNISQPINTHKQLSVGQFISEPAVGRFDITILLLLKTSRTGPTSQPELGELRPKHPENGPIFVSCKMPEFLEKSPLSEAGKHPDFQVTSCHHFDSTDVKFDD